MASYQVKYRTAQASLAPTLAGLDKIIVVALGTGSLVSDRDRKGLEGPPLGAIIGLVKMGWSCRTIYKKRGVENRINRCI